MGNEQGKMLDTTTPEGVRAMDENLQKKFSKGIQYNMKVIIRGDRNTGKTCLFNRMQGKGFTEAYIPTDEIKVAHIQWTYPCTSDTVKVEIWDVVDQGRSSLKKGKDIPLKLTNESSPQDITLDAAFLDVYKGAHCVIFLYDITKQWTWQYIERELPLTPLHIPIVVMGNYCDMKEHRNISSDDAEFYVTHLNRPEGAADIRYAESCMKNGFGLRYLHKFLSIPFLQLQQESLLHQLKNNREQIMLVSEGLDSKEEQDYDKFIEDRNKPPPAPVKKKQPSTETPPADTPPQHTPVLPTQTGNKPVKQDQPSPAASHDPVATTTEQQQQQTTESSLARRLSSKFTGFLSRSKTQETPSAPSPKSPGQRGKQQQAVGNVEDFVPEGELDDRFFEGGVEEGRNAATRGQQEESDSDEGNPQVAMDEDLSSLEEEQEEEMATAGTVIKKQPSQESDEDEEETDDEKTRPAVAADEDLSSGPDEPHILQPAIVPAPPKATPPIPRPLRSAHDVVITDSEEEEEEVRPVATRDKDVPQKQVSKTSSSKSGGGGLMLTHNPPAKSQKPSGGLLLDFNDSGTPSPSAKEKKSKSDKTHKKKKRKSESHGEEKAAPSPAVEQSNDPFDFADSLDAWLSADNSPTIQPRSTHSLSKTLHQSVEETEEKPKKKKKHRDRDSEGTKKKKSKSRKSESGQGFDDLL